MAGFAQTAPPSQPTLPTNASLVAGRVTLSTPAPTALVVTQLSDRAVIDWSSFSIGTGNSLTFVQPTANAAVLNRVTGGTASTIAGNLVGNGQIYLVNPNGIAITQSGSVQVGGGFVASTLDLSNTDFLRGDLRFVASGTPAEVSNSGAITAGAGGYVALLGDEVTNTGTISAPLGKVGLGSGQRATLDLHGDGFLQVALPTTALTAAGQPLIDQSGVITAEGGRVELRAATVAQALRDAVYVSGSVTARSVRGHDGLLIFDGGAGGSVNVSGAVSVAGNNSPGGTIIAMGRSITLESTALADASGSTGGTILIGGEAHGGANPAENLAPIPVDNATTTTLAPGARVAANGSAGAGGEVVVWSDQLTDFRGAISATGKSGNGGTVEVSSHGVLNYGGNVNVRSQSGRTGNLLLDPSNVTISTGADINHTLGVFTATGNDSVINTTTLDTALASANVTVSTGAVGTQAGTITVANPLNWTASTVLTLSAANSIAINASITAPMGGLTVAAGPGQAINVSGAVNVGAFNLNQGSWNQNTASLPSFAAANFTIGANGSFLRAAGGAGTTASPYLITDVFGLQGIGTSATYLGNSYSLANDIDASSTSGWNAGAGFIPIGAYGATGFSGTFNGQGHAIVNLDIQQPMRLTGVGLFGYASFAHLDNISLLNATISGDAVGTSAYTGTGALVGVIDGTSVIDNALSTGTITDTGSNAGGLVGAYRGSLTFTNSSSAASVSGTTNVGGLVGGAVASLTGSSLSASGAVSGSVNNVGGLIGLAAASGSISDAFATGSVTVAAGGTAGGLIGYNSTSLSYSYATGAVSGGATRGGLVGINTGTISNSFWNTTTSGQGAGYGSNSGTITSLTGASTTALQTQSTYSGWDFTNAWYETAGYYPTLRAGTTILGGAGGNLNISTAADSSTNFNTTSLQNLLTAGSVLVSTTNGTLTVSKPVTWSSSSVLDLASSNVLSDATGANITATGTGGLGIYGASGTTPGAYVTIGGSTLSTGSGNLTVLSPNAGSNDAISLNTGSGISVGSGSATINGTSTTAFGVYITGTPTLSAAGGSLTLSGTSQAPTVLFGGGVEIDANTSMTTHGTVILSGTGGTTTGGGHGVVLRSGASILSSGSLDVVGQADVASGSYNGIYLVGNNTLTDNLGTLTVTGGGITSNVGIEAGGGTLTLVNNGPGSLSLNGTGNADLYGVNFAIGTALVTTGAVSITGASTGWTGINVSGGNSITASGGNLSLTGNSVTGTGILFGGSDSIIASGSTTVVLNGNSTGTASLAPGIGFLTNAALTASGTVTLNGNSASFIGTDLEGANSATDVAGNLTLNGTSSGSGMGVYIASGTNALTNSGTGTLAINGTGVMGDGIRADGNLTLAGSMTMNGQSTSGYGALFNNDTLSSASGSFTVNGNSSSSVGLEFAGTGTLQNAGAGTLAANGSSGTVASAGVSLATTSLTNGAAGTFSVVGDNSATAGAGVQIVSGQTVTTAGRVTLTDSGSSAAATAIAVQGSITDSSGALTLAPTSGNDIVIAPAGSIVSVSSGNLVLTTTGAGAITNAGTISQGSGGSGSITLTTANGSLTNAGTIRGSITAGAITLMTTGSGPIVDGTGTISQAGSGALLLETTGTGDITSDAITYSGGGADGLTLSSAGNLTIANPIGSTQGALAETLLSAGSLTIGSRGSVSGASPVLSAADAFVNNAGGNAVTATTGRWLVYSGTPSADTFGDLNSNNTALWDATYAGNPPGSVTLSGNRYLFALQPTLTVASLNDVKTYGTNATTAVANDYSVTGAEAGVSLAFLGDVAGYTGTPTVTSSGSAATATVAAGPYAINVAPGSVTGSNGYAVIYQSNGELTVNPASLTLTAGNQAKGYGSTANLGSTNFGETGLVNGDTLAGVTLTSAGSVATASVAGGPYPLVPTAATGMGLGNYTISYVNGQLTVTPALITVSALGGSSVYGTSAANPGLSATGLQNGEAVGVLSGLSNSFGITSASSAGSYTLNVLGTLSNANYSVTGTHNGTWVVLVPAAAKLDSPSQISLIPRNHGSLCIDRDGPHYVEQLGFPLTALADSRFDRRGCIAESRDAWRHDPSRLQ